MCTTIQINVGKILLSKKKSDTKDYIRFHLYEMPIIGKSIDKGNKLMVPQGWEEKGGVQGNRSVIKDMEFLPEVVTMF